jgi:hemoglobin
MTSLYEQVGGQPFFDALVRRFYERVEVDPVLRPLYPEDLGPGERHLAQFLAQYWGGPTTYSEGRGHPRLRLRHAPFAIGQAERDAWYDAMAASVAASGAPEELQTALLDYFAMAADHLVNA